MKQARKKKERGLNHGEIIFVELKKRTLKKIRGNPAWLRLRKTCPGKKRENLEKEQIETKK